jgi:hypothetical protein
MRADRRGSWYLLTGVILGIALGLLYSWLINPVKYVDAPPYSLRAYYKDEYRALIASAYLYNRDLLRAQERLVQLKDDNPVQVLALQAQQAHAEGHPIEEVQALNALALAMGGVITPGGTSLPTIHESTPMPSAGVISPTPLMNEPTNSQGLFGSVTPTAINDIDQVESSPLPPVTAPTPSPTPSGTFVLRETHMMCDYGQPSPLIQVELRDAVNQPVPGVEVIVSWEAGQDHFFTGLQPELGTGYGDFVMTPGITYSIHLPDGGQAVNDLTAAECTAGDGNSYWGSWYLLFVKP